MEETMRRRRREKYIQPQPLIAKCRLCGKITEIVISTGRINNCGPCLHKFCAKLLYEFDELPLEYRKFIWETG